MNIKINEEYQKIKLSEFVNKSENDKMNSIIKNNNNKIKNAKKQIIQNNAIINKLIIHKEKLEKIVESDKNSILNNLKNKLEELNKCEKELKAEIEKMKLMKENHEKKCDIIIKELEQNLEQLQTVKKVYVRRYWFPARLQVALDERTIAFLLAPNLETEPISALTTDGVLLDHDYFPFKTTAKARKLLTYGVHDGVDEVWDKKKVDELMEQLISLINTHIHYDNIYKFIKSFLKHILPTEMLGPKNNKILLFKTIEFIRMNRFETFNKLNLFSHKEFSFNEMKWLQFKNFSKKKYCEIGILLKNFVMKTLIHWIFNFILVQLFRSHFFVTEKQGEHFKSLYYHKIIYDLIIKICFDKYIYITNQYQKTNKKDALDTLITIDSAPGKLRLMPKASTMRPITSFKKKTLGQGKILLKNKLFDIQKIFKYIQNKMQNNSNNCVVFDYKEIMKRLINFKLKIIKTSQNSKMFKSININTGVVSNPQNKIKSYLNYVTMDIEACYDNINIALLNKFLDTDDTISPAYVTGILYVLIPKVNKVKENIINSNYKLKVDIKDCFDIKLLYMVSDLKEFFHMLDYIRKSEDITYKNCIIYLDESFGINYKLKESFIPTVRNIINNNYIKFNRNFLKQTNGIPQGLSVSSFLCNLFFYEIEKELSCYIQRELNNNQSLLLRFMDDYLCLSNTESNAAEFKDNSIELSHKNKFNFNMKKMKSNINFDKSDNNKENNNNVNNTIQDNKDKELTFTWNGMFFNVTSKHDFNLVYDLKLRGDEELSEYSKLLNVNLPILKDDTDYTWFIKKINSVLFSGHPWIYFMNNINDKKILELNFKNLLKFVFFKVIVLIRKVENTSIQPSQNKLINILDTCVMKFYSFLDNKIFEIEGNHFFIPFEQFHKKFYCEFFKNYFLNKENNKLNSKIISYSPLLFKAVKRKIEKLKLGQKVDVIQNMYEDIIRQLKNKRKKQA